MVTMDEPVTPTVKLTEADKRRLREQALKEAQAQMKADLEEAFLLTARIEAMEAMRPKRLDEEQVSILIDLPDGTGLLTDGKLFQHGREYLVARSIYDDMRARIAQAWRVERELNNPFSGSKFYRPAIGQTVLRGGESGTGSAGAANAHRY